MTRQRRVSVLSDPNHPYHSTPRGVWLISGKKVEPQRSGGTGMGISQAELDTLIANLRPTALICNVCGDPLHPVNADFGSHPMCDPTPAQTEPPPSTIKTLRRILINYEAASDRSTQVAIGPSEIGVDCDRRLAYRTRGIPQRQDGRVKWAPMQGTATHATIADALGAENTRLGRKRWLIEQRVHPDPDISGSCDAYDTDTNTVVDWKLVGPTRLAQYRRKGPGSQYEKQIQIYGLGWQRGGRTPRWVRIVFLPRSANFDEAYEWTAPYDRLTAEAALDRLYRMLAFTADLDVEANPAMWAAIPAKPSSECRWCPYFRPGGPADATGCPGDVAANQRHEHKFTQDLIV